jgi:hypothetical protein
MDFISTTPRPLLRREVRRQRRIWVWIWIHAVCWHREGGSFYGMGGRMEVRVVFRQVKWKGGKDSRFALEWHLSRM